MKAKGPEVKIATTAVI